MDKLNFDDLVEMSLYLNQFSDRWSMTRPVVPCHSVNGQIVFRVRRGSGLVLLLSNLKTHSIHVKVCQDGVDFGPYSAEGATTEGNLHQIELILPLRLSDRSEFTLWVSESDNFTVNGVCMPPTASFTIVDE